MKFKETTNFGRLSLIILKYKATNMLTFALMKAIRYVGQGKIKSNEIYVKLNVYLTSRSVALQLLFGIWLQPASVIIFIVLTYWWHNWLAGWLISG